VLAVNENIKEKIVGKWGRSDGAEDVKNPPQSPFIKGDEVKK
jgi:hypothetical protein